MKKNERELFEQTRIVPCEAVWNGEFYGWGDRPNITHPFNNLWEVWQDARATPNTIGEQLRELFAGWPGCSNHGCVVTGPKEGQGTNSTCRCLVNANRQQLNLLQHRIQQLSRGWNEDYN